MPTARLGDRPATRRRDPRRPGRTDLTWADRSDLDLLVAHRRSMFRAIGGFTRPDLDAADPVYRRWIAARLRTGRAVAVVARRGGAPVGSAVAWLREDQPRPGAPRRLVPYLMSVFVEPAERGRGIASRMTVFLLDWARESGYPRTVLHASKFGRSVYRRLGFRRTWEMRWGPPHRSGPEPSGKARRPPRRPPRGRRRPPRRSARGISAPSA